MQSCSDLDNARLLADAWGAPPPLVVDDGGDRRCGDVVDVALRIAVQDEVEKDGVKGGEEIRWHGGE